MFHDASDCAINLIHQNQGAGGVVEVGHHSGCGTQKQL